jgi:hypothetical protein
MPRAAGAPGVEAFPVDRARRRMDVSGFGFVGIARCRRGGLPAWWWSRAHSGRLPDPGSVSISPDRLRTDGSAVHGGSECRSVGHPLRSRRGIVMFRDSMATPGFAVKDQTTHARVYGGTLGLEVEDQYDGRPRVRLAGGDVMCNPSTTTWPRPTHHPQLVRSPTWMRPWDRLAAAGLHIGAHEGFEPVARASLATRRPDHRVVQRPVGNILVGARRATEQTPSQWKHSRRLRVRAASSGTCHHERQSGRTARGIRNVDRG